MHQYPELLSPAGSLKNMRYAFAYGADAVYAGQPRYSLRVRNNEFDYKNLAIGIAEAHSLNKKFYVVCNISPHNSKIKTFLKDIEQIINLNPDALIMSDPGLIMQVRENFPKMAIHLSVQSNVVNWASAKFWQKCGIERIILSRELSLEEIEEIKTQCPDLELEVFVHGALCMAYSGRCLLSGYLNKRDPNQGTCTNACRWSYKVHEAEEDKGTGDIKIATNKPADSKIAFVEEPKRSGQMMPVDEDEHGTYIMNSKDLRAIEHVDKLTKMGIDSLKIEGRTKSFYYCARTAQIYKQAIKDAAEGKPFNPQLLYDLESLAHRGYTEGFYKRHNHSDYQNYEYGYSVSTQLQFVGEVVDYEKFGYIQVIVKNKFSIGDKMQLMTPQGNQDFILEDLKDRKGNPAESAKGDGHIVYALLPKNVDLKYALLMRYFVKGQNTREPYKTANTAINS